MENVFLIYGSDLNAFTIHGSHVVLIVCIFVCVYVCTARTNDSAARTGMGPNDVDSDDHWLCNHSFAVLVYNLAHGVRETVNGRIVQLLRQFLVAAVHPQPSTEGRDVDRCNAQSPE